MAQKNDHAGDLELTTLHEANAQLKKDNLMLSEKIRYLEQIISFIPANVYWKNKEGVYLGCNDSNLRALGLENHEQFVGKKFHEMLDSTHHSVIEKILKVDDEIMQSGRGQTIEEKFYYTNGEPAYCLSRKEPLRDSQGKVIGLIGVSIDITEKKKIVKNYYLAQQELTSIQEQINSYELEINCFKQILNAIPGNLYWKDCEGRFVFCNLHQLQTFGLKQLEQVVGKTDHELAPYNERIAKETFETDQKVIHSGEEIIIEESGLDKEGQLAYYLSRKVPMFNVSSEVIGIIGVSIDVTRQKKLDLMRINFVRNLHHDIRTPFMGILSLAQCLYEMEDNISKKDLLSYVVHSAEELLTICNRIVDFSKMVENVNDIKYELINLRLLLEKIRKILKPSVESKNLYFDIILDPNMPDEITSDYYRLESILLNLTSNAVKFTHQGGVSVQISMNENHLVIRVEDTGIGIPPDKLDLIFELFGKINLSDSSSYTGLGLGLPLVKKFVNDLGGTIKVFNKGFKSSQVYLSSCGEMVHEGYCQEHQTSSQLHPNLQAYHLESPMDLPNRYQHYPQLNSEKGVVIYCLLKEVLP